MHPLTLPDHQLWNAFLEGKPVTVYPVMLKDYYDRIIADNMLVEVWFITNSPPQPHHIGKVEKVQDNINELLSKGEPMAVGLTILFEKY